MSGKCYHGKAVGIIVRTPEPTRMRIAGAVMEVTYLATDPKDSLTSTEAGSLSVLQQQGGKTTPMVSWCQLSAEQNIQFQLR